MTREDAIISLSKKGLHLVPWRNRNAEVRKPIWSGWLEEIPSIERIQSAVLEYPAADWAIVPKSGFMVIDLDVKGEKNGVAIIEQWCNANGTTYEQFKLGCPNVRTYSGGTHLYFRYEGSLSSSDVADGVEAKHQTESVHVPPSEGYSWEVPFEEIETIPYIPMWFVEKWEASINQRSEVKLYNEPIVKKGMRHDFLVSYAAKLRDMAMSVEEIKQTLKVVASKRFEEPMDVREIEAVADSFSKYEATDTQALALMGDPTAKMIMNFGNRQEVVIEHEEQANQFEPRADPIDTLPAKVLHPNEMIGQWCKAVDYNCPMSQPIYCLSAAIAGIGTLMGRRYTFHGCYANNYIIMLGPTSTGKNAPLAVTKAILRAVGVGHLIGASELTSGEGIAKQISERNEILWIIDELSFLLRGLSHTSAPPYLLGINKQLLQLYSGGSNEGSAKAEGVERVIENPYPNILACAQPSTFTECITKFFIESGFLGRFVCLTGRSDFHGKPFGQYRGNDKNPILEESFIEMLKSNLSEWQAPLASATGSSVNCGSIEIESTDDANDAIQKYFTHLADIRTYYVQKSMHHISDVISKNREKLLKFCMVHAYSSNPRHPIITVDSVEWAKEILNVADSTMEAALCKMTENTQHKDVNKLYDFIKRSASKGVTASEIAASIASIKKKERDAILEDLIFSGKVVLIKDKSKPGRPKMTYYTKQHEPKEKTDA